MKWETAHNTALGIVNRDINLLFQRMNFFLITTAFLLAAFGTLVSINDGSCLIYLSFVVCAGGLSYSLILASTNYLNSRIISDFGAYIRYLEGLDTSKYVQNNNLPHIKINEIVEKSRNHRSEFMSLGSLFKCAFLLMFNARKNKGTVAEHTFLIPLFFFGVWLALVIVLAILL